MRTMLFVNTKRFAERLVDRLARHGLKAGAISGDIPQAKRMKILADFKAGRLPILVATDVASRGLHIDGVTHVINVDLPMDPEDYVHRIGRTARAGHSGRAISLACEDYVQSLSSIEKLIGMKIPVEHPDDALFVRRPAVPREPVRVSGGPRHSAPADGDDDDTPEPQAPPPPPSPRATRAEPRAPRLEPPPASSAPPPPPPLPPVSPPKPPAPPVEAEPAAVTPLLAVDAVEESAEPPPGPPESPADFWTREAFGLEIPEEGFGVAASPAAAGDPARRRRRRRRRPASPPAVPAT
jgi:ATP-dependent RNA helicase RhlB